MSRSTNGISHDENKDGEMKLYKLHTKCVPDAKRLDEAIKTLVGDKDTVNIEMRHSVYNIRSSIDIDLGKVVNIITGPQPPRSNVQSREAVQVGIRNSFDDGRPESSSSVRQTGGNYVMPTRSG